MNTFPVQQHIKAVNAALAGKAGELVLMNWNDADEAIGWYYRIAGMKPKAYFEGWHIAVGILLNEPIRERWVGSHWSWQLPTVDDVHELVVWPEVWRWQEVRRFSAVGLGGSYPSLEAAEDLGSGEFGTGPVKAARRAQIVIGEADIVCWLQNNRHTGTTAPGIFDEILQLTKHGVSA